jgi:hypothetical protein
LDCFLVFLGPACYIFAVFLFVFAFIFVLASLGKSGVLGDTIYSFLSVAFGLGYFLIPIVLIMLGIAFVREFEKRLSLSIIFSMGGKITLNIKFEPKNFLNSLI